MAGLHYVPLAMSAVLALVMAGCFGGDGDEPAGLRKADPDEPMVGSIRVPFEWHWAEKGLAGGKGGGPWLFIDDDLNAEPVEVRLRIIESTGHDGNTYDVHVSSDTGTCGMSGLSFPVREGFQSWLVEAYIDDELVPWWGDPEFRINQHWDYQKRIGNGSPQPQRLVVVVNVTGNEYELRMNGDLETPSLPIEDQQQVLLYRPDLGKAQGALGEVAGPEVTEVPHDGLVWRDCVDNAGLVPAAWPEIGNPFMVPDEPTLYAVYRLDARNVGPDDGTHTPFLDPEDGDWYLQAWNPMLTGGRLPPDWHPLGWLAATDEAIGVGRGTGELILLPRIVHLQNASDYVFQPQTNGSWPLHGAQDKITFDGPFPSWAWPAKNGTLDLRIDVHSADGGPITGIEIQVLGAEGDDKVKHDGLQTGDVFKHEFRLKNQADQAWLQVRTYGVQANITVTASATAPVEMPLEKPYDHVAAKYGLLEAD